MCPIFITLCVDLNHFHEDSCLLILENCCPHVNQKLVQDLENKTYSLLNSGEVGNPLFKLDRNKMS